MNPNIKQDIKNKIKQLAKEKNAIILAHNYQPPEIQDIADLCGDSLELSIKASQTDADIIVFCGVKFMAETASILSPEKTILLPNLDAGCPMADMITPAGLEAHLKTLPEMPVVTYVNSSAAVKAESPAEANAERVESIRTNDYFYQSWGRPDLFSALVSGEFEPGEAADLVDINNAKLVGLMWGPTDQFALVEDGSGNGAEDSATVEVPHSRKP